MKRDDTDAMKISRFLIEKNPFEDCIHLTNTENGEVEDSSVNIHNPKIIGPTIIKKMVGQSVLGYSYKRNDMVLNMSTKTVECEGEQINIDN